MHKTLMKLSPAVDFIYILPTTFLFQSIGSFSLLSVSVCMFRQKKIGKKAADLTVFLPFWDLRT